MTKKKIKDTRAPDIIRKDKALHQFIRNFEADEKEAAFVAAVHAVCKAPSSNDQAEIDAVAALLAKQPGRRAGRFDYLIAVMTGVEMHKPTMDTGMAKLWDIHGTYHTLIKAPKPR